MDILQFALLGLGAGAVYAALGTGVVLTYKAAGVVNIALGAMAMYAAYTYSALQSSGVLVLPIGRVQFSGVPVWAEILISLAMVGVLGLLAYALVYRPLRAASGLLKLVAGVGVTLLLQSLVVLRFSNTSSTVPASLYGGR